jgi:nitrite reductase/ring-hydroxylating ferredoxin subunit/DMSO/TMAO reductase YedYZ heme-binding membrane subunit
MLNYVPVIWNRQKKLYDRMILTGILGYLILYAVVTLVTNPETTLETLIIRAFGTLAILMLHIILCIGPLSRLDSRFLPLLYNRRHLGVSMFLVAAVHGIFSITQFHTLGNVNPIVSVFTSNLDYTSLTNFPFQVLGFFALLILFFMAATSHDFWLANLGAKTWKYLHMGVYKAYALVILHVFLGAYQQETSPFLLGTTSAGLILILFLHLKAGLKQRRLDRESVITDGWVEVGPVEDIPEDRAKIVISGDENIAVFRYEGKLSAISNVCKHQNGPLGEGKIIDGCVTCPWHGYQYLPHNGQSPPPFTEKVKTYHLRVENQKVYVNPEPNAEGTEVKPLNY